MSLQFEFPVNLTAEKFIAKLSHEAGIQLVSRQPSCKTYCDSFDWRLYLNDITCEFNQAKAVSSLTLRSIKKGLNPLYDFLLAKQQKAPKELAKKLQSAKYLSTLSEWEQHLKEPSYKNRLSKMPN